MESTLHRQLKDRFGAGAGGRNEVVVDGYRIDAVGPDGDLVEVQSAALGPLRAKLARLLPDHRVRVIKPIAVARRLIRRARSDGPDLSSRRSPRRGQPIDVFDDLIGLARVFPDPNLRVEILAVEIDEVRVPRRRRPGFAVVDRRLRSVVETIALVDPEDLWSLLPDDLGPRFTSLDLAERIDRPVPFAQRVAYCLRLSGAAEVVGKSGNRLVYERYHGGPPAASLINPGVEPCRCAR